MSSYQTKNSGYMAIDTEESPNDIEMIGFNVKSVPVAHIEVVPKQESVSEKMAKNIFTKTSVVIIGVAVSLMMLAGIVTFSDPIIASSLDTSTFDANGRYIMRDFDSVKPMANFLNGIAGVWGVPMWAFYVNRGQAICSFGKQNKDGMISKFNTAEKAYQQTPFTGFRTFLKGTRTTSSYGMTKQDTFNYMPFYPRSYESTEDISRNMMIGLNELEIEEINDNKDLQTNVLYYSVPYEDFPALIRKVTFTNLATDSTLNLEVVDGLARLEPSGLLNGDLDAMGRTMEAWMNVYNVGTGYQPKASIGGRQLQSQGYDIVQPFYHISQGTADTAQIQIIKDGHFALSYIEDDEAAENSDDGLYPLLPYIVDPNAVFGVDTTATDPSNFYNSANVSSLLSSYKQCTTGRTPSAYSASSVSLAPGENITIVSIYGHSINLETFVGTISPRIRAVGWARDRRDAAKTLVSDITKKVATGSNNSVFDAYVRQNFLDNLLRGGIPLQLGTIEPDPVNPTPVPGDFSANTANKPKIFHTFSRIHGDIERDYNFFQIDTTYYSQGPGNFRDVAQNRRSDNFHSPHVKDFNVLMFLSFVQADGYNPLTVASTNFKVPAASVAGVISMMNLTNPAVDTPLVRGILAVSFRPGQFFADLKTAGVKYSTRNEDILSKLIYVAEQTAAGQFAQNGFWTDHWTYTLDLVDNFLAIYPDQEAQMLFHSNPIPFFMSPAYVKPRAERYSLVADDSQPGTSTVRVYNAVTMFGDSDYSPQRLAALQAIWQDPNFVQDLSGAGGVWQRNADQSVATVSAFSKLLMLGVLKYSTIDSRGMGIEMEGGKPGWNDAMNGLPGLLGSSMPEVYEMLRIVRYLGTALQKYRTETVVVPEEFATFLTALESNLDTYIMNKAGTTDDASILQLEFNLWDANNDAREAYRASLIATFTGNSVTLAPIQLEEILFKIDAKVVAGIDRALSTIPAVAPAITNPMSPTYFYYKCIDYEIIPPSEVTLPPQPTSVEVKSFDLKTLPIFLEGPVRQMKITRDINEKRAIYNRVKASEIYDAELQMYKLSAPLAGVDQEVGRMMAFSPGWLENQSVWLHMSYKFYLELLRGQLYEEFFTEISTGLVPFMNAIKYGRSPLEAASFIVSSEHPDQSLHGSSFLARLSGSTAEFLSMWSLMMAGPTPFQVLKSSDGKQYLSLSFAPVLPYSFFNQEDNTLSFTFLSEVTVTYHNTPQKDTWTMTPKSMILTDRAGVKTKLQSSVLLEVEALRVRNLQYVAIDVFY